MLRMKICVIYGLPCILNIGDIIKFSNNPSNKGLSHYFKKNVDFRQRKNLKVRQKICG